jgi:hypothetical protein
METPALDYLAYEKQAYFPGAILGGGLAGDIGAGMGTRRAVQDRMDEVPPGLLTDIDLRRLDRTAHNAAPGFVGNTLVGSGSAVAGSALGAGLTDDLIGGAGGAVLGAGLGGLIQYARARHNVGNALDERLGDIMDHRYRVTPQQPQAVPA